jgi:hypothetical protein
MTPSASAAAERSRSRSSIVPGSTAAPAAPHTAADESDRARPVTWCPAAMSSGTTADPMCPLAPVMNTRMMQNLRLLDVSRCHQRSTTDVGLCHQS